MFVIKSSRYLQACSSWVVLMMICTNYSKKTTIVVNNFLWCCMCGSINAFVCTSVSPMWGFLIRFCKQLLSVLVSSRLVDFRNMSSISVELESQHLWLRTGQYSQITDILSAWFEIWVSESWIRPTCGSVIQRIWGWHKWTLWPEYRSAEQTGTLAASLENPATHIHIQQDKRHRIRGLIQCPTFWF